MIARIIFANIVKALISAAHSRALAETFGHILLAARWRGPMRGERWQAQRCGGGGDALAGDRWLVDARLASRRRPKRWQAMNFAVAQPSAGIVFVSASER
jgi:hypothetical protein